MAKILHAQQRAIERIGKYLTEHDLSLMAREIECGNSVFQRDAHEGRSMHLVNCPAAGRHLLVVYDPEAQIPIITILPDEHFEHKARVKRILTARKRAFKREVDIDWVEDAEHSESVDIPIPEPSSNEAMAEALRKAFEQAGMSIPTKDISA